MMKFFASLFGKRKKTAPKNKEAPPEVVMKGQELHINLDVSSPLAVKRHLTRCANILRAMPSAKTDAKALLQQEYQKRKQILKALGYTLEDAPEAYDMLAKELG